jgi:hypothetical protein
LIAKRRFRPADDEPADGDRCREGDDADRANELRRDFQIAYHAAAWA